MMKKEDVLSALVRLKVETGSLACMSCGLEHSCGTKGCRIIKEGVALIMELERKLQTALGQLRKQEDACESCKHSGLASPCIHDEDPVMLCDTCNYECPCKECRDYSSWEWNEGGTDAKETGQAV